MLTSQASCVESEPIKNNGELIDITFCLNLLLNLICQGNESVCVMYLKQNQDYIKRRKPMYSLYGRFTLETICFTVKWH